MKLLAWKEKSGGCLHGLLGKNVVITLYFSKTGVHAGCTVFCWLEAIPSKHGVKNLGTFETIEAGKESAEKHVIEWIENSGLKRS